MSGLCKYSGAGNTFIMIDGRSADTSRYRDSAVISSLCAENHTDGLIILSASCNAGCDFRMEFYNPDGTSGMMCGNGGRCVVAFAADLGLIGSDCRFQAPDGEHKAWIIGSVVDAARTIRLQMCHPSGLRKVRDGWFIDTGTRHFVEFVDDVESVDVEGLGRELRYDPLFAPLGVNVNFVQPLPDGSIKVRTYEKGVERETLACGTGITASALVSLQIVPSLTSPVTVHAREADLSVESGPSGVFLTGPAGNTQPSV